MSGAAATMRWRVSGRVQGVFFRAWTREQALRLALDGSATNLDDGSVEVVARGAPQSLAQLEAALLTIRQQLPEAQTASDLQLAEAILAL